VCVGLIVALLLNFAFKVSHYTLFPNQKAFANRHSSTARPWKIAIITTTITTTRLSTRLCSCRMVAI
jgi:hypothetical protein